MQLGPVVGFDTQQGQQEIAETQGGPGFLVQGGHQLLQRGAVVLGQLFQRDVGPQRRVDVGQGGVAEVDLKSGYEGKEVAKADVDHVRDQVGQALGGEHLIAGDRDQVLQGHTFQADQVGDGQTVQLISQFDFVQRGQTVDQILEADQGQRLGAQIGQGRLAVVGVTTRQVTQRQVIEGQEIGQGQSGQAVDEGLDLSQGQAVDPGQVTQANAGVLTDEDAEIAADERPGRRRVGQRQLGIGAVDQAAVDDAEQSVRCDGADGDGADR